MFDCAAQAHQMSVASHMEAVRIHNECASLYMFQQLKPGRASKKEMFVSSINDLISFYQKDWVADEFDNLNGKGTMKSCDKLAKACSANGILHVMKHHGVVFAFNLKKQTALIQVPGKKEQFMSLNNPQRH